jgi:hypothetical protein
MQGGMWRLSMSSSASTTVSFEDHFGLTVPGVAGSSEQSTRIADLNSADRSRLGELVDQMRRSVVGATEVTDLEAKSQLWETYRTTRTEALAMVARPAESLTTRRLRSV